MLSAKGKLRRLLPVACAIMFLATITGWRSAHALAIYSQGAFPAESWFRILAPYALVTWPVLFVVPWRRRASAGL